MTTPMTKDEVLAVFLEQMDMLHEDFRRYSEGHPDYPFVVVRESIVSALNCYSEARATIAAWNVSPDGDVVQIPLNDDTKAILGRMCFQCIHHADALRQLGHDIPTGAEHEQAAVLHWLLNLYLKHGSGWMGAGNAELQRAAALSQLAQQGGESKE